MVWLVPSRGRGCDRGTPTSSKFGTPLFLIAMASNLIGMASNLLAMKLGLGGRKEFRGRCSKGLVLKHSCSGVRA